MNEGRFAGTNMAGNHDRLLRGCAEPIGPRQLVHELFRVAIQHTVCVKRARRVLEQSGDTVLKIALASRLDIAPLQHLPKIFTIEIAKKNGSPDGRVGGRIGNRVMNAA